MKEIIFLYLQERCHARIVDHLEEGERYIYIGNYDGYQIHEIKRATFDQFGFVAVRKEK